MMAIGVYDNTDQFVNTRTGELKAYVKFGGSDKDKYVPNVNMSFFSDEFFINLNRDDKTITSEVATLTDGKIKQKKGIDADEYYLDPDGNLKWDIVWDSVPEKMDFVWKMEYTDGIEFFYQPELTQEEIDSGAVRPDNVIGSYAIYCNKKNNKYKTGKLCHIYRPFVIDANNKKEWCVIEIKNKKMTITLPESFMNTAVYPVRLDPTFGYTSVGTGQTTLGALAEARAIMYNSLSASGGENVSSIHIYARSLNDANVVNLGIYSISGGLPDTKAGSVSDTFVSEAAPVWHQINSSIDLAAGTYNCAVGCNGLAGSLYIYYDVLSGTNRSYNNSPSLTDTWTSTGTSGACYSIYATYTAGGVSTPMSVISYMNNRMRRSGSRA